MIDRISGILHTYINILNSIFRVELDSRPEILHTAGCYATDLVSGQILSKILSI